MLTISSDERVDDEPDDAAVDPQAPPKVRRMLFGRASTRSGGLVILLALLGAAVMCSLAFGSKPIPFGSVVDALFDFDPSSNDHLIVRSLRGPRTITGLLVGAALFVVIGIHSFGIATLLGYVWFAFAGAAIASVVVYTLGSLGREGATPVKLALAGAAITSFLASITTAILLLDVATLDQFRFWNLGSLAGRNGEIVTQMAPFIIVGTLMAMMSGRALNALALGDDVARSLGQRVGWARVFSATAVVVLVGAATAAAGPIAFVGLTAPHVARAITGPDYRWVLPYSAVLAPILLLVSDVIGRVVAPPGELQVGIVTALIGSPFFVILVRRRKLAEL